MAAMEGPAFYRAPDPNVCQGDIFTAVPHIHLKQAPLEALQRRQLKGSWGYAAHPFGEWGKGPDDAQWPPVPGGVKPEGQLVPALCQIARGILISYDCEIENDQKHRLVALVRRFHHMSEQDAATIRGNQNFQYFYLPPEPTMGIDEGYVDLRRLTTVDPQFIDPQGRLASLTDTAVAALRAHLYQYLTRSVI